MNTTMNQRILGPNGPSVGEIGFGSGPLCFLVPRPSVQEVARLLAHAVEQGVTLWDTADGYYPEEDGTGYGERLLAKAAATLPPDYRQGVILATKGGMTRPGGGWAPDGHPEFVRAAIDASLQALDTTCLDLWQLHSPDPKIPFADTLGAIAEAFAAGKVKCVGLSNVSAAQIEEAAKAVPIASVQNRYSFTVRTPEQDGTLDKCRDLGIAFLPYSPLGGGGAAGKLNDIQVVTTIAQELGISPQRVVLAWLLQKYDRLIPIPGSTRLASLQDSAGASGVQLTPNQIARLDNWS